MGRFVDRELDVLLATSIIESGLDIPSANTIVVNRADHFGLAQLYQLRGRVGRSRERAYAYLLVPARRPVTADARKRLEVLQRFSELGAGFQIASHDLEIRGAGNLLGKDQSGHIEAIGFELYSELLDEAVASSGASRRARRSTPTSSCRSRRCIPDGYMPDVHQRLFFYKRLAQAGTDEELDEVRAEMIDRCGDPPDEVDALCQVMAVKVRLRALRIRALEAGPGRLVLTLGEGAALDPFLLAKHVQASAGALRLTPDMKLVVRLGPRRPRRRRAAAPRAASARGRGPRRRCARRWPRPCPPHPRPPRRRRPAGSCSRPPATCCATWRAWSEPRPEPRRPAARSRHSPYRGTTAHRRPSGTLIRAPFRALFDRSGADPWPFGRSGRRYRAFRPSASPPRAKEPRTPCCVASPSSASPRSPSPPAGEQPSGQVRPRRRQGRWLHHHRRRVQGPARRAVALHARPLQHAREEEGVPRQPGPVRGAGPRGREGRGCATTRTSSRRSARSWSRSWCRSASTTRPRPPPCPDADVQKYYDEHGRRVPPAEAGPGRGDRLPGAGQGSPERAKKLAAGQEGAGLPGPAPAEPRPPKKPPAGAEKAPVATGVRKLARVLRGRRLQGGRRRPRPQDRRRAGEGLLQGAGPGRHRAEAGRDLRRGRDRPGALHRQVTLVQEEMNRTLEQVKPQIVARLSREKKAKEFDEWLKKLRGLGQASRWTTRPSRPSRSRWPPAAGGPGAQMPGLPGMSRA